MKEILIKQDFKHTRKIDNKDKFFIVKILLNGKYKGEAGWIEKTFVKEDFIKKFPYPNFKKIEILNIIEFTDYEKYKKYKENQ